MIFLVKCFPLPLIPHSKGGEYCSSKSRRPEFSCTIECFPGFELVGPSPVIKCGWDGEWIPSVNSISCERKYVSYKLQ